MTLDVQTLMVVLMVNMIALSLTVPAIMGWRKVGRAARCAQGAMVLQAVGWACMVLAKGRFEWTLATLGMTGLTVGQALLWESMRGWLGPRPGQRLVWWLAVLTPLGYSLGFGHYAFRVGWANFGLALQMLTVCVALAWPAPQSSRGWRLLIGLCLVALAVATGWRGVLGAFFTASYPDFRAPHPVNLVAALISNLTLVLSTVGLLVAWREEAERALHSLARTDGLTGLLNRRGLQEGAVRLLAQAQRHGDGLAVLLIDLDHFKQVNDVHGHAMGDRALQLVGQLLGNAVRRGDLGARWGGEEFCLVLGHGGLDEARRVDQRLRQALARRSGAELGLALGFSSGLAVLQPADDQIDSLLRRADAALYVAKANGRGQLVVEGEDPSAPGKPAATTPPPPPAAAAPEELPPECCAVAWLDEG